jgi:hypothetical protein
MLIKHLNFSTQEIILFDNVQKITKGSSNILNDATEYMDFLAKHLVHKNPEFYGDLSVVELPHGQGVTAESPVPLSSIVFPCAVDTLEFVTKDGKHGRIITTQIVYVCNDWGKTVEKYGSLAHYATH